MICTLLLTDVFENCSNKCIEIYELDLAQFFSVPGLAWQGCLKKIDVELELLTDIGMLLMVQKGIRGGICHEIHQYATANNKYMKVCNKNNKLSYIMYWGTSNLYGRAISQELPVDGFKRKKVSSTFDAIAFNEKFIKNYDEDSDIAYILEVDVEYPKRLHNVHNDLPISTRKNKN